MGPGPQRPKEEDLCFPSLHEFLPDTSSGFSSSIVLQLPFQRLLKPLFRNLETRAVAGLAHQKVRPHQRASALRSRGGHWRAMSLPRRTAEVPRPRPAGTWRPPGHRRRRRGWGPAGSSPSGCRRRCSRGTARVSWGGGAGGDPSHLDRPMNVANFSPSGLNRPRRASSSGAGGPVGSRCALE